jgi:hypothetical protein
MIASPRTSVACRTRTPSQGSNFFGAHRAHKNCQVEKGNWMPERYTSEKRPYVQIKCQKIWEKCFETRSHRIYQFHVIALYCVGQSQSGTNVVALALWPKGGNRTLDRWVRNLERTSQDTHKLRDSFKLKKSGWLIAACCCARQIAHRHDMCFLCIWLCAAM